MRPGAQAMGNMTDNTAERRHTIPICKTGFGVQMLSKVAGKFSVDSSKKILPGNLRGLRRAQQCAERHG